VSAAHAGNGDLTQGQHAPPGLASVRHLARHQVMGLAGVFLLGMAVNLLGGRWRRQAVTGAIAIVAAFGAGALTLATKNNWWSYAMAVGFIAALLAYGSLLLPASADHV